MSIEKDPTLPTSQELERSMPPPPQIDQEPWSPSKEGFRARPANAETDEELKQRLAQKIDNDEVLYPDDMHKLRQLIIAEKVHTPTPEALTPEIPGGELLPVGFPTEGLNVLRSSGEMDAGLWSIERVRRLVDDETGEAIVVVGVTAPAPVDSPYKALYKNIRLSQLEKWNPASEEEDLAATHQEISEALGRDNFDDEPVVFPEDLKPAIEAHQGLGHAALLVSGAEKPIEPVSREPNPGERQSARQIEADEKGETFEDLQQSFHSAEKAILEALNKPGTQEYYEKPRYQEEVSRKKVIEQELAELREKIDNDSLDDTEQVILFGGVQSRDVSERAEVKANVAVEWLYYNLCEAAGLGGRNYYDIEKMVKQANDRTTYKAIRDSSGELAGVRLDLGGGVYANFNIGNLNDPDNTEKKMSSVRLEVHPSKE